MAVKNIFLKCPKSGGAGAPPATMAPPPLTGDSASRETDNRPLYRSLRHILRNGNKRGTGI
jgi:hypothetical protein